MNEYEKQHIETLRPALSECMVLLRCNGDFPIKEAGKLAAYGNGMYRTIKGGTGSGEVNSRYFISIEDGLKEAGFELTTAYWKEAYEAALVQAKKEFKKALKKKSRAEHTNWFMNLFGAIMPEPDYEIPLTGEGDTAIYVVSRISGEGSDRKCIAGDYSLTETEIRDILYCKEHYEKFILVINAGGPVDLSPVMDVENILVLSQLGVETGAALADVLLGKANPSGKLATTWQAVDTHPDYPFGEQDETCYEEGIYVGYRYYDTFMKEPLFPFGFGLSYTDFELGKADVKAEGETITVSVPVTNIGLLSGKEVVQVYVSSPDGNLDQPYQALAGFAKTEELAPGKVQEVVVTFRMRELASYDTGEAAYMLEAGKYVVRVGNGSRNTEPAAVIELDETTIVRQVRHAGGVPSHVDLFPVKEAEPEEGAEMDGVPVICVNRSDILPEVIGYDRTHHINPNMKKLTDEEICYLNIGAFDSGSGIRSVVGSAASRVAGAAGESTSTQVKRGFPAIVMADGPAGLRLAREYYVDEKGAHATMPPIPESLLELLPAPLRIAAGLVTPKPKKGTEIKEQYTTALPIGTAIAQSFNVELAEMCGDIVGDEMERFGVHLWLAPALNIHRDVRCGRNFEYFSEDPLISGKMAAALTKGVQKHPGCGVTIKHYCANNQEFNRYGNNSQISERALREIYLKGFDICVEEAQPCAVMTSYNLLNGTHTSERRDLIEDVLRTEFGFTGIVMTDWVIGGTMMYNGTYGAPVARRVAASGHELFMPGSKADYKDLLEGLKAGEISREQLEINATRLYAMAKRLCR